MNRETIEQVANDRYHDNTFAYKGFINGAEWFVDTVWHDSKEKADAKPALVEYLHVDGSHGYLVSEDPSALGDSITRWVYLDDLIPGQKDKKGKRKPRLTTERIEQAVNSYIGFEREIDEGVDTLMRREAFKAGIHWLADRLAALPLDEILAELSYFVEQKTEEQ